MDIDLTKFQETFFEEASEIVDEMEQILLQCDENTLHKEKVNTLFRAFHTIKGNSATFNFVEMTKFSHAIEALLDRARAGTYQLKQTDIDFLLAASDFIREMLSDYQHQQPVNVNKSATLIAKLNTLLEQPVVVPSNEDPPTTISTTKVDWKLTIKPNEKIFSMGIEPYRLFRAIKEFGEMEVVVNTSDVPDIERLIPENCYLSWTIFLRNSVASRKDLDEVFEWIKNAEGAFTIEQIAKKEKEALSAEIKQDKDFSTIRVSIDKIDALINSVGELVITQLMLEQEIAKLTTSHSQNLIEVLSRLNQNSRQLQESVMHVRMVPISYAFSRLRRIVRDIALKMNKKIKLEIIGEQTEIDKKMMEKLIDPLTHLVRNAIDHGIELPSVREEQGKPATGLIELKAYQEGGNIIIVVKDDGFGLNKEKILARAKQLKLLDETTTLDENEINNFIFLPGFSTSESANEISGRGVGLDVVYKNIHALHGRISISSAPGEGTSFSLTLPLTLAIMDCQLFTLGEQTYIIPLISIIEILKIDIKNVHQFGEGADLYYLRGVYLPIIYLNQLFNEITAADSREDKFIIIVEINDHLYGLVVDNMLAQQQVVIKSLEDNYKKIPGISGATVLGDGNIALIVDVESIISNHKNSSENTPILAPSIENESKAKTLLADDTQLLIFQIGNNEYAIDMLNVVEISTVTRITRLPGVPMYIKGVLNLRGLIVPVIDLNKRLDFPVVEQASFLTPPVVIVLKLMHVKQEPIISILADSVVDTCNVSECEIESNLEYDISQLGQHTLGLITKDRRMITVLDVNSLEI